MDELPRQRGTSEVVPFSPSVVLIFEVGGFVVFSDLDARGWRKVLELDGWSGAAVGFVYEQQQLANDVPPKLIVGR